MKYTLLLLFACVAVSLARDCSWMEKRLVNPKTGNKKVSDDEYEETITRIYPYRKDLETLLNYQIKNEMNAFYSYLSISHFFGTEENDLPGFAEYFHKAAMEELKHAEMFMNYQAKRGGRNKFMALPAPARQTWSNGLHAFKTALTLEKNITDEILCLHQLANERYNDVDLVNFLEGEVIPEQYSGMKELTSHIKTLQRVASAKGGNDHKNYGLAEFHFDQKLKSSS